MLFFYNVYTMVNNPEQSTLVIIIGGPSGTGKTTTAKEIVRYYRTWKDVSATLFQPSELLRREAAARGIPLLQRSDYHKAHMVLEQEDPNFMTRRIEQLTQNYGVVCIDGLRKYSHAKTLQHKFSQPGSLVTYRTSLLEAQDSVRHDRVLRDAERRNRPESVPQNLNDFIDSEMPDIQSTYYQMRKVWEMRDAPATPIDTSHITPWGAAKIIISAVRKDVSGTLIRTS